MSIRVVLVDDQSLFRAGIALVIDSQPDLECVGEAEDGSGVIALVRQTRPDVVLMDVRMPQVDGVTATRTLIEELGAEAPKVLVLTTFDLDQAAADAIEAGASGFVLKESQPEFLLAAIRAVAAGTQVVSARAIRNLLERFRTRSTAPPGAEYEPSPRASGRSWCAQLVGCRTPRSPTRSSLPRARSRRTCRGS